MRRLTISSVDDLISDFLEICGRESLAPNYVLSNLLFMWIMNEGNIKDLSLSDTTFSSLKLCYGDIQ